MAVGVADTIEKSSSNIMSLTGYFSQSDKVIGGVMDMEFRLHSVLQKTKKNILSGRVSPKKTVLCMSILTIAEWQDSTQKC
jgi:hypothetical protein